MAPDRSSTHPLQGRTRELATLGDWVGVNGATPARAVLLAGDAGVGKTRLLTELVDDAERAGWRALIGHCLDFGDTALPYLPFSELVGRLASTDPDSIARLIEAHPAIAALAPGRRMLSGAGKTPADDLDRGELFDAVHGVLEELAVAQPVLVVIEDVHWADQSTRDLLSFLFARSFRGPVSLVASYRTDDLHRRHPLRATAAEWARMPGVQRLVLGPLPDADVRRLVRSLHTGRLRERDVARIVDRAEGNAFFAEELLGASEMASSRGLPDDLADLLLVRLDRLDDAGRAVVRAASCAGRRVSHDLLARVLDLSELEMERALRSAVDSNVLVHVAPDGYSFRHALLAEAVYDDLLPGERVRLHAAYAKALVSEAVDGTAAELAMHARAAHDIPTAIQASITAGQDAMAVGGPDEAAQHYELALEMVGQSAPDDLDVVGLVIKACDAIVATGHPSRALALATDHLRQLPADAPAHDRAKLLISIAGTSLVTESQGGPLRASTEALSLIDESPSPLRARALSVHARSNVDQGQDDEAARFAMEALSLAQRLDMPRVVAEATTTLAGIDTRAGQVDLGLRALQQVVDNARKDRDTASEMRGQFLIGQLHYERGALEEAQAAYALACDAAKAAGRPWAPYGFDARLLSAMTAYLRGDWDLALELSDVSGEAPPADPEALMATIAMMVGAGRGDADALKTLDEVRSAWEREGQLVINSGTAAIDLLGDAGRVREMLEVFDDMVDVLSVIWNPLFQARIRATALVLGQLATAASTATHAERASLLARAPDLVAGMEAVRQRVKVRKRPFGPEGLAWVLRVHAEHLRLLWLAGQDTDEAELLGTWEQCVEAFEVLGHQFELARSRARYAAVLKAAGRTAEAEAQLAQAREWADKLGAKPLLAELDAVSARPRAAARKTTELTGRESEILSLVAQGKTNGDIAKQLFISTKTVSVHVSNILAKLGAGGRTEAAAIARRDGLLP